MKIRKLIAGAVAAAMSLTAIAVGTSAALYEDELAANGAPTNNAYKLAGAEGVDYSKVAKIEAVVTTTDYVNGTIGVSANSEWTTPGQLEATAGTSTWVLDGLTGIDGTLEDGTLKEDVVQVQFWWLNAGSFSLDSLKLFDAEGNVLQEAGVDVAVPTTPDDSASYNVEAQMAVQDNVTWATQTSDKVSITKNGDYTFKLDGLSIDPATLTVLYIKDAYALEQGDGLAADYKSDFAADAKLTYSLKINGADVAIDAGMPAALADLDNTNVFDFCFFNTWATSYITLPTDTITSIELTVSVGSGSSSENPPATEAPSTEAPATEAPTTEAPATEAPTTEAPTTEAAESEAPATSAVAGDTNTTTPDKGNADTGVEGVAVVAGIAVVAALGVVIAKKRK